MGVGAIPSSLPLPFTLPLLVLLHPDVFQHAKHVGADVPATRADRHAIGADAHRGTAGAGAAAEPTAATATATAAATARGTLHRIAAAVPPPAVEAREGRRRVR